ncbi:MAG: hypothetical protein ACE5Q3_16145 [Alphaproteobacteria bacterium]
MVEIAVSELPLVEETEAEGEVARLFDDIKEKEQIPFVPNIWRGVAGSPELLEGFWKAYLSTKTISLPAALTSMIGYSISAANRCTYCNTIYKVSCSMHGVDDEAMAALQADLTTLTPQRVQEIVRFATKCGMEPESLTKADYDRVRDQGLSDQEIVEVIVYAAWCTFADRIADALKIEVDPFIKQAAEG